MNEIPASVSREAPDAWGHALASLAAIALFFAAIVTLAGIFAQ